MGPRALVCNKDLYFPFVPYSCAVILISESLNLIVHAACMISARLISGASQVGIRADCL